MAFGIQANRETRRGVRALSVGIAPVRLRGTTYPGKFLTYTVKGRASYGTSSLKQSGGDARLVKTLRAAVLRVVSGNRAMFQLTPRSKAWVNEKCLNRHQ